MIVKNRDTKFYIFILCAVVLYWILSYHFPFDEFTKRITTTTTLIAAVAFWLQFKRNERLSESNYIMNLNQQFISNKDMSFVEHELELYYNQYEAMHKENEDLSADELQKIHLGISQSRTSDECQKLINYLVYLEALAALVGRQVIHLGVIDDLFSYRFFLAVNNPVVQQDELFPYADYYQGIFKLSEKWTKSHIKKNIAIPMRQYNLPDMYKKWKENPLMIPLDITRARSSDNKTEIAECLYETDRYIYPEAFGDDKAKAAKIISRIVGMDGSLLDYKNFLVARFNGQVCGICLLSDGKSSWDRNAIINRVGKELFSENLLEGFNHASKEYFESFENNPLKDSIEIVACCVDEGFRRKRIASAMLTELINRFGNKIIRLTVLENNYSAIQLYEKKGFVKVGESIEGYAPLGLRKPMCIKMERKPGK